MISKTIKRSLALSLLLTTSTSFTAQAEQNTIKSIVAAKSGDIEITVSSSRPFPVRNALVSLQVGSQSFSRSRSPADGSLDTLIFMVPAKQFAQLTSGANMAVQFGQGQLEGDRWAFGKLNKTMLAK